MVKITLRDGTTLETDEIFSIWFELDGTILIKGWKDGLNQTLDDFPFGVIRVIHFERSDELL